MLIHSAPNTSPALRSQFTEHKPRFSTLCKTINLICVPIHTSIAIPVYEEYHFPRHFSRPNQITLICIYYTKHKSHIFIKNLSQIKFADKNFRNWFSVGWFFFPFVFVFSGLFTVYYSFEFVFFFFTMFPISLTE